jgi:hypothetical protein
MQALLTSMTTDPSHDEISERARNLWQARGQPQGQDNEIWLDAERELRASPGTTPLPDNATLGDAARAAGKTPRSRGGAGEARGAGRSAR